jgi:putative peptidoglycan lipid II flippase
VNLMISRTTKQLLIVGFLLIVTKLVALFKEVYLAQTFGIGSTLDTYFVALTASSFLPAVFLAVLPSVLVPYFVKLHSRSGQNFLLGNLSFLLIVTGLLNAFLLLYFSEDLSLSYQFKLGTDEYFLVNGFIDSFAFLPLPLLLIAVFSSYLLSVRSNANSVIEIIPNVVLIVAVFFFSAQFAEKSLAVGTIVGSFLHAFCLILIVIAAYKSVPSVSVSQKAVRNLKYIAKGGSILFFGQFFMSLLGPIDNYFAVSFGEGSVASYNYAMKLIGIGSSLISVLVLRVILPKFSELERDGKHSELRHLALYYSLVSFVVILIASILVFPFVPYFLELIYQGGNLTPQALMLLSDLVLAGMFQLPFFVASLIIVQCYLVKNWVVYVALFAISNVAVKSASNLVLTELWGLSGLMYSWATMYLWSALWLFILFKMKGQSHASF